MKFKSPQILKLEYLRNKTFLKRNRSSSKKSSSTSFILLIFSVCMTCVRRHSKMYPICNIRLSLLKREGPHMWRMCSKPNYEVSAFIDELWKPCNIRILKKWKKKKNAGDIIILHMYTKNHIHMRYSSWDTKWDNFFCHFGPFFAFYPSFPPPPNKLENQNF